MSKRKFWYAVATLVGSTIGVGIYGIPFAFQKAGLGVGFLFLVCLVALVLLSNLLYGELILRTHERHQLIGYTNKYLGKFAGKLNLLTFMLGAFGALIGILVVIGNFLVGLTSPVFGLSPVVYSTLFLIFAGFFIFRGRRSISRFDLGAMLVAIITVLLIVFLGVRHIDLTNFTLANKSFWFLPFGVILFAVNGMSGIPLTRETLAGNEGKLKKVLIVGSIIPALIYLVFAVVVVGISGETTTPDAISGLLSYLGNWVIIVGSFLGLLTSSTIFLNLATALKESFQEDFHFGKGTSFIMTVIPPYLLFISGIRNFIDIIGLVGGVAISIETIILIFLYAKVRKEGDRIPEYSVRLPMPVLYFMMFIFAAGAVYTLIIK